jgi:hypothetical protein
MVTGCLDVQDAQAITLRQVVTDPFDLVPHLRVGLHRVPLHTVDGVSIDAAAVVDVANRHDIGHLPLIQPMPPKLLRHAEIVRSQ